VAAAVEALKQDYERPGGLQMVEVAGGYQIVTRPELHEWVRRLFNERTTQKLSVAALETLAVVAYKQPVTGPEVAEIRGVNAVGVIGTLIERKLVKIVGRKQVVGRPFLYGTTREFLERFGLNDLSDLPRVEDMSELLGFDLPSTVGKGGASNGAALQADRTSSRTGQPRTASIHYRGGRGHTAVPAPRPTMMGRHGGTSQKIIAHAGLPRAARRGVDRAGASRSQRQDRH
jgi:segregation and condensation protein B